MKNYICIPNSDGNFISLKACDENSNEINKKEETKSTIFDVSKHDDRKSVISSRLQYHINYQNGLNENGLKSNKPTWEQAKSEISVGHKTSHWIWYVFPVFFPIRKRNQMTDLILKDLDEVRAYIAVDILRNRLIEITQIANDKLNQTINPIWLFGDANDASKFWECITVFFLASINWRLPTPSKRDVEMLHKVCGEALRALHPHAKGEAMLHPATVKAVIKQDSTIHDLLNEPTYHQKYIKYKYKYLQYKKTLH